MERLPYYQLLHILALLVLVAHTFMALAQPAPENRRRTMIITGIAALLLLISGFGLLALNKIPYTTGWVLVKLFCLIGLSGIAGIVYRRAELRGLLSMVALLLAGIAVFMVYFRPF
jgi:uncharacterized membrane protein SirB2